VAKLVRNKSFFIQFKRNKNSIFEWLTFTGIVAQFGPEYAALGNYIHGRETIIHHSDRCIQYCCPDYSEFAVGKGMVLSTTDKYDPYENAVDERISGILKYEFGLIRTLPDLDTARKMVKESVATYNRKRRHRPLAMKTPDFANANQQHDYISYRTGVDGRVKC